MCWVDGNVGGRDPLRHRVTVPRLATKGCGCWVEQNRRTRPTSPQTVPRLAAMTATRPHACARAGRLFVRSEYSNALVGDGVPQPAPRSANLDSAFGGMQLLAPEAWRAAPLLLIGSFALHADDTAYVLCGCHSCDSDGLALTGPQSLVAAACVSDTLATLLGDCRHTVASAISL